MRYNVDENCLTIYLPDDVDHCSAEDIRKRADQIIKDKHIRYVVFDFQDTGFMDSSGIGVIMGRYRLLSLMGGAVSAINANQRIRKILRMSGVSKFIQVNEGEK